MQVVAEVISSNNNVHATWRPGGDTFEFTESTLVDHKATLSTKGPAVSGRPRSDRGVQSDTTKVNDDPISATVLTPISEETFDFTDIRSLISEGEDGASQVSGPLPAWGLDTENAIVSVLAKSSLLTPLYERALQLMPKERFINNFRRLLKGFHTDIVQGSEKLLVTRQLAAILRSRERCGRIAQKIVLKYLSDLEATSLEDDLARLKGQDDHNYAYLDLWLYKHPILFTKIDHEHISRQQEETNVHVDRERERDDSDDSDDSDGSEADPEEDNQSQHGDFANFPRLDMVMRTLIKGRPFQDMITGMKELLLPPGLLDEILPIPRAHIRYDATEDTNILSSFQGFIEDITALPWDRWPLPPKMHKLRPDETRVHWRCVRIPAGI
jgi:hypothetical protein